jgi:hypothetical protein
LRAVLPGKGHNLLTNLIGTTYDSAGISKALQTVNFNLINRGEPEEISTHIRDLEKWLLEVI